MTESISREREQRTYPKHQADSRLRLYLPQPLLDRLGVIAARNGHTLTHEIRSALEAHVDE